MKRAPNPPQQRTKDNLMATFDNKGFKKLTLRHKNKNDTY